MILARVAELVRLGVLALWTTTATRKRCWPIWRKPRPRRGLIATSYAIARLRRFFLDLAVRGKLLWQDPNDEPASELPRGIAKRRGW
jgi:hypothetical protein